MPPQKLVVLFTTLTGGALGLFAPVGVVKWLLQTEPEAAGILTLFFLPVWFLLVDGTTAGGDCDGRSGRSACHGSRCRRPIGRVRDDVMEAGH